MNSSSADSRGNRFSHYENLGNTEESVEKANIKCRGISEPQHSKQRAKETTDTLDLLLDFVSSLMERNYGKSLQLCKEVIHREPWNKLAQQFLPLLLEKNSKGLDQENQGSSGSDSDSGGSASSRAGSTSASKSSSDDDDGSGSGDSTDGDSESDSNTDIDEESQNFRTVRTEK